MKKRLLAILLTVSMMVAIGKTAITAYDTGNRGVAAETTADYVKCGDNLDWSIKNGILTISGDGDMYHYDYYSSNSYSKCTPWYFGRSQITRVVIEEGVTGIGNYAFAYCSNLTSISIPESVESIGADAFNSCSKLTSVTIPSKVTRISGYTFYQCVSLASVTIGSDVQSIEEYAFYNCRLTNLTIPSSVTSIGRNAFSSCGSLTTVTIPNKITTISTGVFSDCTGLTSVTIPDSITSIGKEAFYNCKSLTSVTIPQSVKSIATYAFEETGVKDVYYTGSELERSHIDIADNNSKLTSATWHYAYWATGSCGDNVIWSLKTDGTLVISGSGPMYDYQPDFAPWYSIGTDITAVKIESGVTTIGNSSFLYCSNIKNVSIPNTITSIGCDAFYGCSFERITIPDSVKSIGDYAFYACQGLTNVVIPDSVESIGQSAFYNCCNLTSVDLGGAVQSIGPYAFDSCVKLTNIIIPDSVTTIGRFAFNNCIGLKSVIMGNKVQIIGQEAFICINLTDVYYVGTQAEWNTLKKNISSGNGRLLNATIHFHYGSDHSWGEGVVTTSATCTTAGVMTYTCTGCGETKTETIPAGHQYTTSVTAPTCTAQGYTTYTCTRCSDSYVSDYTEALGHAWNSGEVTTPATCTTDGVKTYTCSRCGDTYTADATAALGHTFGEWETVTSATCTGAGSEQRKCTACGYIETRGGDATGHSWNAEYTIDQPSTCTTEGSQSIHCSKCDAIKDSQVIPALGHTWDAGTVTTAATCKAEGVKTYTCTVCGETKTEAIPVTDHVWDAGKVTTEATATTDGVKTYTCTICGETKTETIPATGSQTDEPEKKDDPTNPDKPTTPEKEPTISNPFGDVRESDYFYDAVLWGYEKKIVYGTTNTTFSPYETCTRAQVITFLYRAAGEPKVSGKMPFVDVQKSDYYYNAVLWGYQEGIVAGMDATHFGPGRDVSRAQFITFLWRYEGKPAAAGEDRTFTDLPEDQYYTEAVKWGHQAGVVAGIDKTHFGTSDTTTRGQVVTFLYRDLAE